MMKTNKVLALFILITIPPLGHSRSLTFEEKLAISSLERTVKVKEYMRTHIDETDLTWRQWGEFKLLLKSCRPVLGLREKIENSSPGELADQSKELFLLYNGCQEGVLSLTRIYTEVYP